MSIWASTTLCLVSRTSRISQLLSCWRLKYCHTLKRTLGGKTTPYFPFLYDVVVQVMRSESQWLDLHRSAFRIENEKREVPKLRDQVQAGLQLYILTAELLEPI